MNEAETITFYLMYLFNFRLKYKPEHRHVRYGWLLDSLQANDLLSIVKYTVLLKSY